MNGSFTRLKSRSSDNLQILEKYIFELIPDITKLDNFPSEINDETIANYFGLSDEEKTAIDKLHKKNYNYFPE